MIFEKTYALSESGYFSNFTDYHSHILPGVDDGIKKLEDSISALKAYEEAGIRTVWLTPHIMEDIPNSVGVLKERFELLKNSYDGPVTLFLASENMMDTLFEERLSNGDLLPLSSNRLLVETSYFNPPMDMYGIISDIKRRGYFPVIAHPERYLYMGDREYKRLAEDGVEFQLNLGSLFGAYGNQAKKKAEVLLKRGYYNYAGTDLHSMNIWRIITNGKLKKSVIERLKEISE